MREIELRKCYEEYEWRHCTISNHDVKLFDCKYDAIDYLDRYHELYIQTPSNWDIRDYEGRRVEPSKWLREETKNDFFDIGYDYRGNQIEVINMEEEGQLFF